MKTEALSIILPLLLVISCARTQERPHISVPSSFAVKSVLIDKAGEKPDVLDLIVSKGDSWRIELAEPELQTIKIWIGKCTNVLVASHETKPEQMVKIPSMVFYFTNLHQISNDPELPFLGSMTLGKTPCWVYQSQDDVTLYFRKLDGLLIRMESDRWRSEYTHLDFLKVDYEKALEPSKQNLNISILKK